MELTREWLCVGLSIILWAKSCHGKPLYFVPWLLPYCPEQVPMGARSSSVSGYTENLLKWFNYPYARAHPRCKVSCHGTEWTCIVSSSVIRGGQPNSGESCIVLQSGMTHRLIAGGGCLHGYGRLLGTIRYLLHVMLSYALPQGIVGPLVLFAVSQLSVKASCAMFAISGVIPSVPGSVMKIIKD